MGKKATTDILLCFRTMVTTGLENMKQFNGFFVEFIKSVCMKTVLVVADQKLQSMSMLDRAAKGRSISSFTLFKTNRSWMCVTQTYIVVYNGTEREALNFNFNTISIKLPIR
jgi:agmatine deiminase